MLNNIRKFKEQFKTAAIILLLVIVSWLALTKAGQTAAPVSITEEEKPVITSDVIAERITNIGELSTLEYRFRDISEYESGTIPLLTKKSFKVVYDATVKIGIDLETTEISVEENQVTITLPPAQVFSIEFDYDNLRFYDEKFALFNWESRVDTVEIMKNATLDVEKLVKERELEQQATENAETLIRLLLAPIIESVENPPTIVFK